MKKLRLEDGPYVVGVLSSLHGHVAPAGDIVEVRLDKAGWPARHWLERCREIEARTPVLLTIRLRNEGGDWPADNPTRLRLYEAGLRTVSAVDVELSSVICSDVAKMAQVLNKVCLVSHHDFEKTPPLAELEKIIDKAQQHGVAAKVATMIRGEADVKTLRALLARQWPRPLCVIGMGERWRETRVLFPKLGSCLTYGYLDRPTAPGQTSAADLVRQLAH